MTSTTDTDEHPEVSEISALTDGLLSPSRTADLRDHLSGCALCEDVHASLEEIRGLLGTLPGPTRMPAEVSQRIDAALAAEALLDATAPDERSTVSRETFVPKSSAAAPRTAVSRGATPPPRPSGDGPASTDRPPARPQASSGSGKQMPTRRRSRMRRRHRALLGTAMAAAVIGLGGVVVQGISSDDSGGGKHSTSAESTAASTGLNAATVESHVRELITTEHRDSGPETSSKRSSTAPLFDAGGVPSCVRKGIGRDATPLASARDTYEGRDAFLVVLPHPSDPSRVSAYVVSTACVSAPTPAPGKVLFTASYRRG